ncbi:MAG: tetratricopeptide repeat protein [Myxococcota bacterium]
MRADIAVQRGRPGEARPLYEQAMALHPTLAARYGLAQIAWQAGRYDEALLGLDDCEALVFGDDPTNRLWLDLQRGLVELSRGHNEAALAHYHDAEGHVPGHWLVREHVAEATARLRRRDEAIALYADVVAHPATGARGRARRARRPGRRRGGRGAARSRRRGLRAPAGAVPEAAAGHALHHLLDYGDPQQAVALAEANAALRPNGEALTLLARAYRQAGRPQDRRAALQRAAATGWALPERAEEEARLAVSEPSAVRPG